MDTAKAPRVSICIPTYNQTTYLAILLQSISEQSFQDFEVIISDDSTTPDVKNLAATFPLQEKLKYFKNTPSLGSPANWNAAIEKSRGEYIKIMHHDDAFASNTALAEMLAAIKTNSYDYIFAHSKIENVKDPGQNRVHTIRKFSRLIRKPYLLFFGNALGGPSSLLIKKNSAADQPYDPGFIWLVDIEYYIRLFQSSAKGFVIPQPLILTHDAAEHRLTTSILRDFELQIREQALLYNRLAPKAPATARFFMQVWLARLFFKSRTKNKKLLDLFLPAPAFLKGYFSVIRFKPLYFAYYVMIRALDVLRKAIIT